MSDIVARWTELDGRRTLVLENAPWDARIAIDRLVDGIRVTILTSARPVGPPSADGPGVLTATEVAAAAGVHRATITNWINSGKLDRAIVLRAGRRVRFSRSKLRDMGLVQ